MLVYSRQPSWHNANFFLVRSSLFRGKPPRSHDEVRESEINRRRVRPATSEGACACIWADQTVLFCSVSSQYVFLEFACKCAQRGHFVGKVHELLGAARWPPCDDTFWVGVRECFGSLCMGLRTRCRSRFPDRHKGEALFIKCN